MAQNEIQRITLDAAVIATGAGFKLTFGGNNSQAIPTFDAAGIEADAMFTAILNVTDISASVVTCEFIGAEGNKNQSPLIFVGFEMKKSAGNPTVNVTQSGIADSTPAVTPSFTTTTPGDISTQEVQRVDFNHTPSAGNWVITDGMSSTGQLQWNATSAEVQSEVDSGFGLGTIAVSGSMGSGFTFTWFLTGDQNPLSVANNTLTYTATGRHEIITVTLPAGTDYGTWKLAKNSIDLVTGQAYNTNSGALESAIDGAGYAASVSGAAGGPWTIESDANIDGSSWAATGEPLGKPMTATVTTDQEGVAASSGGGGNPFSTARRRPPR